MAKLKYWIEAFRLRTLPLALSTILMGSFLAVASGIYNYNVIALALITTLLLQTLSNLANDYGDGLKGTDNHERLGPMRALQSGQIRPGQMKIAIYIFVLLSLISGVLLIIEAFGSDWYLGLIFLFLGISAIAAAIKYTVGKKAYGYSGFGDIFVFIFFGLIAVMGSYFLNTLTLNYSVILPSISMGLFSTAVLNLNNMRDIKNDLASGKKTLAAKMGLEKAKKYHLLLISIGMLAAIVYTRFNFTSAWNLIYLICFPMFLIQLRNIFKIQNQKLLDPYLKKLALTTLLFSVLFGIGLVL
ncbi:MAG: 1,4-dihydroxy-2-naphthoate octaprenyltransferase [Marinilabiliales bacterium]|nr:MAG: 1,4-dihydroxy-2-naphthoate octaprenyltransferase [Marinilabiliales bacterium]